jgi:hypothetical protein
MGFQPMSHRQDVDATFRPSPRVSVAPRLLSTSEKIRMTRLRPAAAGLRRGEPMAKTNPSDGPFVIPGEVEESLTVF